MVCRSVYAQSLPQPAVVAQKEIWFDERVGIANSGLINGQEYNIPLQGMRTHPFFGSREITYENLVIDGQRYGNVPIMYDIFSDIVVIRHRDKSGLFALIQLQDNLSGFSLYGHTFRKISATDIKGSPQSPQIFDVLMEGQTVILIAKRKKEIYMQDAKPEYRQEDLFYFLIQGKLVPVTRKKDLLKTFDSQEAKIKDFIKTNNLDIRVEEDLIRLALFCDSLNKLSE